MGNVTNHLSIRLLPKKFGPRDYKLRTLDRYSDEEFMEFCAENPGLRIEMDKTGKLVIIPPVDTDGGLYEDEVHGQLYVWRTRYGKGHSFSPTTGFKLPDGSTRSADGAWATDEKVAALTPKQRKKFARLVPDFVVEIRSESDRIGQLKRKMTDTWLANGVRLAWLIDPKDQKAWIYRPGHPVEELDGFDRSLSGSGRVSGI